MRTLPDHRSARRTPALLLAPLLALAAACSSGTDGAPLPGTVTFVLTDSANDELETFEVDVANIVLTRLDDTTVAVLPQAARVDFTEARAVAELLLTAAVEPGTYKRMTLDLDFTNAVVWIEGQTAAATVLGADGNPITGTVAVQVDFTTGTLLPIGTGRRHLLQIDLDLETAVSVDAAGNTVGFAPSMAAALDPATPKPVAFRGTLASFDPGHDRFVAETRAADDSVIHTFSVLVSPTTVWQIDGALSLGAAGFPALQLQAIGSRVAVLGTWSDATDTIAAVAVAAGAGVRGNGQDWVVGHVIGRDLTAGNDAQLTVLGRSVETTGGTRLFSTQHTVDVALGSTIVLRSGSVAAFDTDDIQIGQLLVAFGDLTGTALDATGTATGIVRLLPTTVFGVATAPTLNDRLTIDVTRFGRVDVSNFVFDVQGITEASPTSYDIDATGLLTTGITGGSRVVCVGFPNPVGVVADPDFDAVTITDVTDGDSLFLCQWVPPAVGAITASSSSGLTLAVGSATIKLVTDAFSATPLNNSPAPKVTPAAAAGYYLLVQNGVLEPFLSFQTFAATLQNRLVAGAPVFRVTAVGSFDDSTQEFAALLVTVVLN